nr:E3 SUMO-protein ligase SIZ1-like isoform X1 [Tanacetum cinerariifolium]
MWNLIVKRVRCLNVIMFLEQLLCTYLFSIVNINVRYCTRCSECNITELWKGQSIWVKASHSTSVLHNLQAMEDDDDHIVRECKRKLARFRVKELKDVLSHFCLPKTGRNQ